MHGSHSLGNLADRACVAPPMVSNHFLSGTDTPVLEAGSRAKDSHDPACGGAGQESNSTMDSGDRGVCSHNQYHVRRV